MSTVKNIKPEEKYLLSTKSHEDWRNYLIVNSFFFDVLIEDLRSKLDIPFNGFEDIRKMMEWEADKLEKARKKLTDKSRGKKSSINKVKEIMSTEYKIKKIVYAPIWEVLEKFGDLDLNFSLIHIFVLGHTNISSTGSSRVYMVTSPANPIEEAGIYIKYSPDLSEEDIHVLVKQAKEAYETLFKITHRSIRTVDDKGKPYIKRETFKFRDRRASSPTEQQLKYFKAIEADLKENYSKNHDSIKISDVFNRVATNLGVNANSMIRSYYALIENFNLPTSVDTKKISV